MGPIYPGGGNEMESLRRISSSYRFHLRLWLALVDLAGVSGGKVIYL